MLDAALVRRYVRMLTDENWRVLERVVRDERVHRARVTAWMTPDDGRPLVETGEYVRPGEGAGLSASIAGGPGAPLSERPHADAKGG